MLEARDCIGGRVCDEKIGNVTAGKGAQIMNGCINNPMAVIVKQVSLVPCVKFKLGLSLVY